MSQRDSSAVRPRYDRETTAMEVVNGVDLRGRFIMITGGAGAGMGYEISRALARTGAHIMIGARDRARGEEAARKIREESKNPDIEVGVMNLASLDSIKGFTENFLTRDQSIDVLIDHAGIAYLPQHTCTEDGFEAQFGTNYIGHFALTTDLTRALRANGGARVIVVSSGGHRFTDIFWDDVNGHNRPYDAHEQYNQSKTALCLFSVAFNRRYSPEGIFANVMCPGGVYPTSLQVHMSSQDWMNYGLMDDAGRMSPMLKTPQQGAATQVWAAVSPELEGRGGLYLENCAIGEEHRPENPMVGYKPYALDPVAADRLWNMTERWLAERGYR
jgi:NAD(P)-dependent dehydrogenase (short-subunit alcohol dehydrogenase family)